MERSSVRGLVLTAGLAAALAGGLGAAKSAAGEAAAGGGAPAVLDEYSYWRAFLAFRPAVSAEKAEGAEIPAGPPRSEPPPADWAGPDFDDAEWFRTCGPVFPGEDGHGWGQVSSHKSYGSREVATVCLRGRFDVPDPSRVESLKLSASYRGGVVVYLNGKEIARGHLGKEAATPEGLADEYPREAYFGPDNNLMDAGASKLPEEARKRLDLRLRRLEGVELPASGLKKGVNVLAIELHRSPVLPESLKPNGAGKCAWTMTGLQALMLAAQPTDSVRPNTSRPAGIQVWNESPLADVYSADYGDPNEPLRPIDLVGVRNGCFSGQVVVSSDAPIKGLQAKAGELKLDGDAKGVIPADAVSVRYPQPDGEANQGGRSFKGVGGRGLLRFDSLAEAPPAEVPVVAASGGKGYSGPLPVPGAVQPVRLTVKVPAEAPAGRYSGLLTLSAEGLAETTVPVHIEVIDWTLPDVGALTSHLGIVQSYETLALHYKVPMWSEEHWKLIDRSFAILGRAGVDELYLPLIMKFHWGRESLVRWVKNEDGTFSHDFSILERYLDTALRHLGKPDTVCLYAWDRQYRTIVRAGRRPGNERPEDMVRLKDIPHPIVPLLDPKTGAITEMEAPTYCDPASAAFWKPVLEGCRERLLKRGVAESAILLGVVPDGAPGLDEVDYFHEAAPWANWIQVAHDPGNRFNGIKVPHVDIYVSAGVYGGTRRLADPADKRYYGWQKKYPDTGTEFACVFPRIGAPYIMRAETCLPLHWAFHEIYLATGLRGASRMGGELWPVTVEGAGKSGGSTLIGIYSHNIPGLNLATYDFLKPGPDGALSTLRLESLHEGAQEGEARVFIEKALEKHRGALSIGGMDPETTERALQDLLDARTRAFMMYYPVMQWYAGSGQQSHARELYKAAAAVAKATAGEPAK